MSRSIGLARPIPELEDSSDLHSLFRVEGQNYSECSRQNDKAHGLGLVTCNFLLQSTWTHSCKVFGVLLKCPKVKSPYLLPWLFRWYWVSWTKVHATVRLLFSTQLEWDEHSPDEDQSIASLLYIFCYVSSFSSTQLSVSRMKSGILACSHRLSTFVDHCKLVPVRSVPDQLV